MAPESTPFPNSGSSSSDAPTLLSPGTANGGKRGWKKIEERDFVGEAAKALSRSLPYSSEAERCLLSCLIQAPIPLIDEAVERITPDAFYVPAHKLVYELLVELHDANGPVDTMTVTQALMNRNKIESVGGPGFIMALMDFAPSFAPPHFQYWVTQVHEKHTLRKVVAACTECIARAYEDQEDVSVQLDQAEQKVLAVREEQEKITGEKKLHEHVLDVLEEIEYAATNPNAPRGIFTGFKKLDSMTKGLAGGDIFVIAARPSMGKTAFAMNIVEHVAIDKKVPVAVFSLEMSANALVRRLLSTRSDIPMSKLKDGFFSPDDYERLIRAAGDLKQAEIVIDDTPSLSIIELRAKARRFKKNYGIGLIALDYLQLCRSTSRRGQDNRQIEIAEISAGLKALAKELNLPIIVLAQLNRQVEQRKGGRPMLSDLRESGSIEQDADIVGLLTRNDYAGSKSGDSDGDDDEVDESRKGEGVLIIAKHRNGATGEVELRFIDSQMRFVDREPRKDNDLD